MEFGWKKKAERLKMVILSAAHRGAKELPPGVRKGLAIFRRAAETGGASGLEEECDQIERDYGDEKKLTWEPIDLYGWNIVATMYLQDGQLWWLAHAVRKNEKSPSDKEVAILNKVLEHLGAQPKRHVIIGPGSSPAGHEVLPFGWWTWQNRDLLYDIQVNKDKKRDRDKIRIVPLGTRATDGFETLDLPDEDGDE